MYVKPAPGRQVRYPEPPYELMPPEGGNVSGSQYWLRRLVKGDVVFAVAPEPTARTTRETAAAARAVRE